MNEYIFSRTKFLIDLLNAFGKNSPEVIEARNPNHWSCLLNGEVCQGSGPFLFVYEYAIHQDWCVVRKINKT